MYPSYSRLVNKLFEVEVRAKEEGVVAKVLFVVVVEEVVEIALAVLGEGGLAVGADSQWAADADVGSSTGADHAALSLCGRTSHVQVHCGGLRVLSGGDGHEGLYGWHAVSIEQ